MSDSPGLPEHDNDNQKSPNFLRWMLRMWFPALIVLAVGIILILVLAL